jgi:hypothetical protein
VQATIDIRAREIVFESDAVLIQQIITLEDYALAPSDILISEIQELPSLNCMTFNVNVVHRICNRVAHALVA